MPKVYIPWSLPSTFNGRHPLVASLVDHQPPPAEFLEPIPQGNPPGVKRAVDDFAVFTARLMEHFRDHPVVTTQAIVAFVQSRDVFTAILTPPGTDLLFVHTVPNTTGLHPWILHIENPTNLLMPFAWQGDTGGVRLRSLPVYWIVRYMLEQPECRAIFTHIKQTAECLGRLFQSERIATKVRYIPLGVLTTPDQDRTIDAVRSRPLASTVTVLFTNSFHQSPNSFVLRGGLEVVSGFLSAVTRAPGLRLILRTVLPDELGPKVLNTIRSHPNIEVIDHPIDDDQLFTLYCRSDIFILPSAGLHALSVARAMYCGLVCIASDAPGFDEYIDDGHTGMVLPGMREQVYSVDAESGWVQDRYAHMVNLNTATAVRVAEVLIRLSTSPSERARLGQQARAHARTHFRQDAWVSGFARLLAEASP